MVKHGNSCPLKKVIESNMKCYMYNGNLHLSINFLQQIYYMWNNGNILYKNTSHFYKNWVENVIVLVKQLLSAAGNLLA